MKCTKPVRITNKTILKTYPQGLEVPCGKCFACRKKKAGEWSMRMIHEMDSHEDAVFVTLTYEGEQYNRGSLCKRDLQLFLKRLRKNIAPKKIRYFACGEYGDQTKRPHYHLIIFGLSLRPEDTIIISDSWSLGMVNFGIAEPASIAYTTQYIDKKFSGQLAYEEYDLQGREPVFRVSSLGIGKEFALKSKTQIEQQGYLTVNGIKQSIPRYYLNKLEITPDQGNERALEKECEVVEHYSGYNMSRDEAYISLPPDEVRMIEDGIRLAKLQSEKNIIARIRLRSKKL